MKGKCNVGKRGLILGVVLLLVALVSSFAIGRAEEKIDTSLAGWWNFNEENGGTVKDSSGYGNDGSIAGEAIWVKEGAITALQLNGVDNYIEIGPEKFDDLANGTIEIWFKCSSAEEPGRVLFSHHSPPNYCNIFLVPHRHLIFDMVINGQVQLYSDKPVSLDSWCHVATTFGAKGMKMYVNGVLQKKSNPTTKSFKEMGSSKTNTIGTIGKSTAYNFHGIIGEARVYNRALTGEEIKNNYDYGKINH